MQSCGYTHSLPSPYQSARPERNAQTAAPMSYLHPNQPSESKCRVYQVSRTLPGPESSFELVAAAVPQLQLVLLAPRSLLLCPCCLLVLPCHLCDGFLQSPKGSWGSSNIRYSVGLSFHIANQLRPVGIGIPALILTLGLTLSCPCRVLSPSCRILCPSCRLRQNCPHPFKFEVFFAATDTD